MSTILAPGYLVKCSLVISDGGQTALPRLVYRVAAVGGPPATDADLAANLDTICGASLRPCLSQAATYKGVLAQIIEPPPPSVPAQSTVSSGTGTGGVSVAPKQVSGMTSWRTQLAGHRYRGRTYWPFVPIAHVTGDGIPDGTLTTAYATLSNAFLNFTAVLVGGRSATVQLCIYHRDIHSSTDITSGLVQALFATQRRRGDFGRLNKSPI